jgi:uncharacterized protein (DUF1015 family)
MAIIKPFNGTRYNEENITKLICPPYDVIPAAQKERLKKASPYNMVQLELPDPQGKHNKYQQASLLFRQWQKEGKLATDAEPSYYFYEQSFSDGGTRKVRRGFFAALHLEDPLKGEVKPHERTLAKPKADRLRLLRSVKANLSPIFGLFNDRNKSMLQRCATIAATRPIATAIDNEGTRHKLWRIDDAASCGRVTDALASRNIFIADGHHRYETAWNYLQERKKKDKNYSRTAEYNYVLAFLCPMEDPGLSIWPTHRVVEPPADLEKRIAEYFDVLPAEQFARLSSATPQPLLVYLKGKKRTLVAKRKQVLTAAMPGKCAAYRELGVSILHSLLLFDVPPENITYVKSEKEAYALARERNQLAVIVPSTPVEAVKTIALAGQTMPQKSTYFFPKIASGIVIHTV